MSQVSQLSPELGRSVLQLARTIVAATQQRSLYPPDHQAVGQAHSRLALAIGQNSSGAVFSVGVTAATLLIEDAPADHTDQSIAEAAALLIDIDPLTYR
jgi:hypothetical protein